MNNQMVRMTTASLAWLSALLLKIAGQRIESANDFPMDVAPSGHASTDRSTAGSEAASAMLRCGRDWSQDLGPFLIMILTLRRQSAEIDRRKQNNSALPGGALFVARYCSGKTERA